MKEKEQAARNPYKTIFSQEVWGGMPMAKIAVHEDWPKEAKYDPDDELPPVYKDIPVEICVAGSCIGTTLDKIINNHKATQDAINQTLETQALALEGISGQCCDNCRELLQLHICHTRTQKIEKNNGDAGTETTKTTSKENTGTKQGL